MSRCRHWPSKRQNKQTKHNVGCILSQQTAVTDIIPVYWLKHQKYSREADAKWKCRVVSWHDQWQTAPSTLVKIMYQLEPNQQAVWNYSVFLIISCEWACSLLSCFSFHVLNVPHYLDKVLPPVIRLSTHTENLLTIV